MSGERFENQEPRKKNKFLFVLTLGILILGSGLQAEAVSNTQANKVYFAIANTAYKFGWAFVPYTCIDNVFTT